MAEENTQAQTAQQPEPAPDNNPEQNAEPKAPEKTFTQKELDDIVKDRLQRERKGQPSKEELEEFRAWQESRKTEEQKQAERVAELDSSRTRITELESALSKERLDTALRRKAAELGVDAASVDYVARLADISGAVSEDGAPDPEKIAAAINKVLTDIPALKPENSAAKGFTPIGADNSKGGADNAADDRLRRAFGLKPKSQN